MFPSASIVPKKTFRIFTDFDNTNKNPQTTTNLISRTQSTIGRLPSKQLIAKKPTDFLARRGSSMRKGF